MIKAVFEQPETQPQPKNHFTIGINDDVGHTSLEYDAGFSIEPDNVTRAVFYGLGFGRHGRREQKLHQDHRRTNRSLRARLFRLRLEKIRLGNRFAFALRAAADSFDVS